MIKQWIMKVVFCNELNEPIVSDLNRRRYITGWYFPCRWIGQSVGQYFRWTAHTDSNEWNDWSVKSFFSILDFRRIVVQSKQYTSDIWWTEWTGHVFGSEDKKYQVLVKFWYILRKSSKTTTYASDDLWLPSLSLFRLFLCSVCDELLNTDRSWPQDTTSMFCLISIVKLMIFGVPWFLVSLTSGGDRK